MPIQVNGALRRAPCPVPSCPACEPNSGSVHPSLSMKATQVERGRHCYAIKWVLEPTAAVIRLIGSWPEASSIINPAPLELSIPMENLCEVIRPFRVMAGISGRERQFLPSETLVCDPALSGETIIIEADGFLLLVDRATFKACCKWKNEGQPIF
jgi:hypothetical protein